LARAKEVEISTLRIHSEDAGFFMASQPPALVVMEVCGSAHHWARELTAVGHEVKLIAPQYGAPFVKRQKNDAADAKAIVIAARQPEMRFVVPKSEDQQARAVLFRGRERLVHQRTELVNALRGTLYEFVLVVPKGIVNLKRIEEYVRDAPAVPVGRQRTPRPDLEGRSGRHPAVADHRRYDPRELGEPRAPCARQLASANARAQATHAGSDRAGEQDGPYDLGYADEAGLLSGSGPVHGGMR
jgi:transposase